MRETTELPSRLQAEVDEHVVSGAANVLQRSYNGKRGATRKENRRQMKAKKRQVRQEYHSRKIDYLQGSNVSQPAPPPAQSVGKKRSSQREGDGPAKKRKIEASPSSKTAHPQDSSPEDHTQAKKTKANSHQETPLARRIRLQEEKDNPKRAKKAVRFNTEESTSKTANESAKLKAMIKYGMKAARDPGADEDDWLVEHYGGLLGKQSAADKMDGLDDILKDITAGTGKGRRNMSRMNESNGEIEEDGEGLHDDESENEEDQSDDFDGHNEDGAVGRSTAENRTEEEDDEVMDETEEALFEAALANGDEEAMAYFQKKYMGGESFSLDDAFGVLEGLGDVSDATDDDEDRIVYTDSDHLSDEIAASDMEEDVDCEEERVKEEEEEEESPGDEPESVASEKSVSTSRVNSSQEDSKASVQKWVPRHLRQAEPVSFPFERSLRGLLNRLSEGNFQTLSEQINIIFRENATGDVTQSFVSLLSQMCTNNGNTFRMVSLVYATLVMNIHRALGMEVGGKIVEFLAIELEKHYKERNAEVCGNYVLFFAELGNLRLVQPVLLLGLGHKFIASLTMMDVELLLILIKNAGHAMRSDDPAALKSLIQSLQDAVKEKYPELAGLDSSSSLSSLGALQRPDGEEISYPRLRFMLDTVFDLKNNKRKLVPAVELTTRVRAMLKVRECLREFFNF